jgi:hypothetical protein
MSLHCVELAAILAGIWQTPVLIRTSGRLAVLTARVTDLEELMDGLSWLQASRNATTIGNAAARNAGSKLPRIPIITANPNP